MLVGARDLDPHEKELIAAGQLKVVAAGPNLPERLSAAVGERDVYVHLDCDVLEPGIVPIEYQVTGGLTLEDLRACATVLAQPQGHRRRSGGIRIRMARRPARHRPTGWSTRSRRYWKWGQAPFPRKRCPASTCVVGRLDPETGRFVPRFTAASTHSCVPNGRCRSTHGRTPRRAAAAADYGVEW